MPASHPKTTRGAGLLLCVAMLGTILTGCAPRAEVSGVAASDVPAELRVSAASSLRQVLEATASRFEADNGAEVVFNFGASGTLQKQIEGGAPADVFVSASTAQVDRLVSGGFIPDGSASMFAGNDLVVLVPKGNPSGISGPEDLLNAGRIVTGNPDTAPHGTKAREWLTALGSWEELRSRLVFAENAAQTLDYVVRGEVDAGIGFASEAAGSDAVEVVYTVPRTGLAPTRYVAAPLAEIEQDRLAAAYVAFLRTPTVQKTLADAGFLPAPKD